MGNRKVIFDSEFGIPMIFIVVFIFSSCNNQTRTNPSKQFDTTVISNLLSVEKSEFYARSDSVIISSKHFDTLKYSKEEFNQIIDNFPSLYLSIPVNPDLSYAQSGYFKDVIEADGRTKHLSFGSEQGQDTYYILYAYFLRQKQNEKSLDSVRENLIQIYQAINDVFGYINYGGTFFVHQFYRINGYAEYGVYEYRSLSNDGRRLTDISKLKQFYLKSLGEIIHQKIALDKEVPRQEAKTEREHEVSKNVEVLEKLITNSFYLQKAQQFHYSYYWY
jgi:hypothetical protein